MKPTVAELENRFLYHKPDADALAQHPEISRLTLALAKRLCEMLPDGRNLSIVLTLLEDVRMRANCAIACDRPNSHENIVR